MTLERNQKKSEKLEVRLTLPEKRALKLEAKRKGLSVSELVRSILKIHVESQPYFEMAMQPVRRHPRKMVGMLLGMLSSVALAILVSPAAQSDVMLVEMLGNIEQTGGQYRHAARFNSILELESDGTGTLSVSNPDSAMVPGSPLLPHRIEISLQQAQETGKGSPDRVFLLSMRIVREDGDEDEVVSEPAILVAENAMANFDLVADSGVRYALTIKILAKTAD